MACQSAQVFLTYLQSVSAICISSFAEMPLHFSVQEQCLQDYKTCILANECSGKRTNLLGLYLGKCDFRQLSLCWEAVLWCEPVISWTIGQLQERFEQLQIWWRAWHIMNETAFCSVWTHTGCCKVAAQLHQEQRVTKNDTININFINSTVGYFTDNTVVPSAWLTVDTVGWSFL